jgi:ATP-dependent RNA helicase RhlE
MSFEQLRLSEPILRAVITQGYRRPTPVQSQVIPHVLAGRDLFACAQTGTGKTAAFALPILHRLSAGKRSAGDRKPSIRVLVLSPTRELAAQIGQSFQDYGQFLNLRHTVIFGGAGQGPQVRALERGVDIVVATPGRLLDLINQGHVRLGSVEVLVLDEADRMLDMGFLPDVRRIVAKLPVRRQTVLFSATMPEPIERLAEAILRKPLRIRVTPVKATTKLIEQIVYFVPRRGKPRMLTDLLMKSDVTRALVFTRTKRGADRVARQLNQAGICADAMHGNKSQSARQRTLADFRSNRTPVLVATDIAARGIDVEGISHVLNYDLPHEPETYVHRIGRTGRAGASGVAVSLCDQDERPHLQAIQELLRCKLPVGNTPIGDAAREPAPTQDAPRQQRSARPYAHGNKGSTRRRSRPAVRRAL